MSAAAVTVEVRAETAAIQRAVLGDRTGRAAQALAIDHLDPSPAQIAAADRLLHAHPLGSPRLFTVDPAAACVAAAHWLAAAAEVTAAELGIDPTTVFTWADDLQGAAVEVPATVVKAIIEDHRPPRAVVVGMLTDALAVANGRHPDPARLPDLVDAARERTRHLPTELRAAAIAGMLDTLTPLDPRRPSRDLLEQLLNGINSCLIVHCHAGAAERGCVDQFTARLRDRAAGDHERITR